MSLDPFENELLLLYVKGPLMLQTTRNYDGAKCKAALGCVSLIDRRHTSQPAEVAFKQSSRQPHTRMLERLLMSECHLGRNKLSCL